MSAGITASFHGSSLETATTGFFACPVVLLMARAAGAASTHDGGSGHLVVVNATTEPREVSVRTWRDGAERRDQLIVGAEGPATVPLPDGSGPYSVEVVTDRGEHASLAATGWELVVIRDGSVLVAE